MALGEALFLLEQLWLRVKAMRSKAWLWFALILFLTLPGPAPAWTLQLAAAFDIAEYPTFSRMLNKSLAVVNRDLREVNVTLTGIALPIADLSADSIGRLCNGTIERSQIVAIIVVGGHPGAFAAAMAAGTAGIPVLWARNSTTPTYFHQEMSPLEVRLEPTMQELLEAVRSLLVVTHWHSFFVISDDSSSAVLLRRDLARIFRSDSSDFPKLPPLNPSFVLLRKKSVPHVIFRRLAEINKSTRGVVLLMCETAVAVEVLVEARRLHMVSNDWVWFHVETGGYRTPISSEKLSNNSGGRIGATDSSVELSSDDDPPSSPFVGADVDGLPIGLLGLRARPPRLNKHLVKGAVKLVAQSLIAISRQGKLLARRTLDHLPSCWSPPSPKLEGFSRQLAREMKTQTADVVSGRKGLSAGDRVDASFVATFDVLNVVENSEDPRRRTWRSVGNVTGQRVNLETIVWPGGDIVGPSPGGRSVFRVVAALAKPFVMEGEMEDRQCLRGLHCLRVATADKDNITLVFSDWQQQMEEHERGRKVRTSHVSRWYNVTCCYGLAMDLLENLAEELQFDFHLYLVADSHFGAKRGNRWTGIMGDLESGAAHLAFAPLSVTSSRAETVDFSVPYFFSGVSYLAAPTQKNEVPLMAFLLPFSPELWIAIFTSLNITAMAVAVYEWLSPFGLNPWGRQRSKNFSIASALWVMWGLLCGHLVAFKAPKSWPNKFLINVWGGFSVIFVASYTANIAALIAGLFFQNTVASCQDKNLLSQRVAAPKASASDFYVQRANPHLWQHMQKYSVNDVEEGILRLQDGSLDALIADTPILDYYRATDQGCKLQKICEDFHEDAYAVGMTKGFPLKDSISAVIAKYTKNGYIDILQEKYYGALPCFRMATDMAQPRPLGVAAVAGVFILLGVGMLVGCLILTVEHLFYKYSLPVLRRKPKGTIWRSRNLMFFSQKLYRFINCVELVSPHHAARELVHTLRQGQITSLFQKSVKRFFLTTYKETTSVTRHGFLAWALLFFKEYEQRRRRKSKAQFFEMIQEIRRVQKEEKDQVLTLSVPASTATTPDTLLTPNTQTAPSPSAIHNPILHSGAAENVYESKQKSWAHTNTVVAVRSAPRGSVDSSPSPTAESRLPFSVSFSTGELDSLPKKKVDFSPSCATDSGFYAKDSGARCRKRRRSSLVDAMTIPPPPPPPILSLKRRDYEGGKENSPALCSALDDTSLTLLPKSEIISLWRTSEQDLRLQLLKTLREKDILLERIQVLERHVTDPP